MRYTNVRHLLHNFKEEILDLPVTVTQLGKPIFTIIPSEDSAVVAGLVLLAKEMEEIGLLKSYERHINPYSSRYGV